MNIWKAHDGVHDKAAPASPGGRRFNSYQAGTLRTGSVKMLGPPEIQVLRGKEGVRAMLVNGI